MKRMLSILFGIMLIITLAPASAGCIPELAPAPPSAPTPTPTPTEEEANFRLLISDEVNAIEDFQHLHVTISGLGLKQAGAGPWIEHPLDPADDPDEDDVPGIDLVRLQGENATEIWDGYVEPGEYIKVFIHVDNVTGILADGGGTANVSLPSDKLQISKPFTLSSDLLVNFVFDITVVEAGKSGQYILKPQIDPSGPNKPFNDVTPKGKQEKEKEREKEKEAEGQDFEGTIDAINGDNWTMTIEGESWTVDVSEAEIDGEPEVGLEAEVKGSVVDDTIVASTVEIEEEGPEKEKEQEKEKEAEGQEFEGTIDAIVGDNWTMTIEDESWTVDVSEAEIDGEPEVGLEAEVKGTVVDDTIVASKVEIEEAEEEEEE